MKVDIPSEENIHPTHKKIFIIDWDDTLISSSKENFMDVFILWSDFVEDDLLKTCLENVDNDEFDKCIVKLRKLDLVVYNLLLTLLGYGEVYIVTMAKPEWIHTLLKGMVNTRSLILQNRVDVLYSRFEQANKVTSNIKILEKRKANERLTLIGLGDHPNDYSAFNICLSNEIKRHGPQICSITDSYFFKTYAEYVDDHINYLNAFMYFIKHFDVHLYNQNFHHKIVSRHFDLKLCWIYLTTTHHDPKWILSFPHTVTFISKKRDRHRSKVGTTYQLVEDKENLLEVTL